MHVIARAVSDTGRMICGLNWADSTWQVRWELPGGASFVRNVPGTEGQRGLIWSTLDTDASERPWIITVEDFGDSIGAPDTISTLRAGHFSYGGAFSSRRRWVGFYDTVGLRVFYSDSAHTWREVSVPGIADEGIAMGAVDDTSAVIVWAGTNPEKIKDGILRGTQFQSWSPPPIPDYFEYGPVLRRRPSGGFWLQWGTNDNGIGMASVQDGAWTDRVEVTCPYNPPGNYYTDATPMMTDDEEIEYPVLGWDASHEQDYFQVFCVARPSPGGGWLPGEQVPVSSSTFLGYVARDGNADIWVAWYTDDFNGMFWTHSYTTATAATPMIGESANGFLVSSQLSEPAPDTWWTILRTEGDAGVYAPVARVQAVNSAVSWLDATVRPGATYRYKVRRDCLDKRYELESGPSDPVPGIVAAAASLLSASATPQLVRLEWQVPNAEQAIARVERGAGGAWTTLDAPPDRIGLDRLVLEDRAITPGARYTYRLWLRSSGNETLAAETTVDVPLGVELALEGARPNPVIGNRMTIALSLPDARPARLEVLDLAGRRVATRDLAGLGAGRHVVALEPDHSLSPGVYLVQLSGTGGVRTAKISVMR